MISGSGAFDLWTKYSVVAETARVNPLMGTGNYSAHRII